MVESGWYNKEHAAGPRSNSAVQVSVHALVLGPPEVDVLTVDSEERTNNVVPIVEEMVDPNRSEFLSAEITAETPEQAVVSSVPKLDRAIDDLVQNAIVHNDRESPSVRVTVDTDDTSVTIAFADDGPLISEMDRKVVTGAEPTALTSHSLGLGLWFVHWERIGPGRTNNQEKRTTWKRRHFFTLRTIRGLELTREAYSSPS